MLYIFLLLLSQDPDVREKITSVLMGSVSVITLFVMA